MTHHLRHISTITLLVALCFPLRVRAADAPASPEPAFPAPSGSTAQIQDLATTLYASLTPEQQKAATLPLDAPERNSEVFTGGKRAGVQIKTLTEDQQKQALALLTAFTSEYGKNKAIEITKQKPDNPSTDLNFGRYYLCYFGDVGPGKTFAWRIAEHHLTLVDVQVDKGSPKTFGPILLGANPPTLWDD